MIIDTHCHIDMLDYPEKYLQDSEKNENITIGMTNLPRHFSLGFKHFKGLKKSRIALGFHPQLAMINQQELATFKELVNETSYIGEVGLDFSRGYFASKEAQIEVFDTICNCIQGENKIVSVHSRHAQKEVLDILDSHDIKNVIFHWYSGPLKLIDMILDMGYYFSINEVMTISSSGRKIISKISKDKILTESDASYNKHSDIRNALKNLGLSQSTIYTNFKELISHIR